MGGCGSPLSPRGGHFLVPSSMPPLIKTATTHWLWPRPTILFWRGGGGRAPLVVSFSQLSSCSLKVASLAVLGWPGGLPSRSLELGLYSFTLINAPELRVTLCAVPDTERPFTALRSIRGPSPSKQLHCKPQEDQNQTSPGTRSIRRQLLCQLDKSNDREIQDKTQLNKGRIIFKAFTLLHENGLQFSARPETD